MNQTAVNRKVSPPKNAASERQRLIRLVHVGKRELGLPDEAYRTILQAQGGSHSSANLNVMQLQRVLETMKRAGFKVVAKVQPSASGKYVGMTGARSLASDPQSRKARAMWLTLHTIGQVRDPSEAALLAYARRQCKVDRLEWVGDMTPLIESLKAWLLRSLPGLVAPYMAAPVDTWAGHMTLDWRADWNAAALGLRVFLNAGKNPPLDDWMDLWRLMQMAQSKT